MTGNTARKAVETVTIPRAEYERLLRLAEDAEDRAALAAADPGDGLDDAELDRLLAGESPLRVWRRKRGLTLAQLAARTGFGKSMLSQVETGGKTGSVELYRRCAEALAVDVDDLI